MDRVIICALIAILWTQGLTGSATAVSKPDRGAITTAAGPPADKPLPNGAMQLLGDLPYAPDSMYPLEENIGDGNTHSAYAVADRIKLFFTATGNFGVAKYHETNGSDIEPYVSVDEYAKPGASITTSHKLPIPGWGRETGFKSFLAGSDGNFYVLTGRSNQEMDDDEIVLRVHRFDSQFLPSGVAGVRAGRAKGNELGISEADSPSGDMEILGQKLVVHTRVSLYDRPDGSRHGASFSFQVDLTSMTAELLPDRPIVSHSFNQFVTKFRNGLAFIDHGDAYPFRGVNVTMTPTWPLKAHVATTPSFEFGGSYGDNTTGVSVTGTASGPDRLIIVGNSVLQTDRPWNPYANRNIFVTSTDADQKSKLIWLTNFSASSKIYAREPRIVEVQPNRFAILFGTEGPGRLGSLEYRLVDQEGSVLAEKTFPGVDYSSICEPISDQSKIFWASNSPRPRLSKESFTWLYGLDLTNPQEPRLQGELRSPFPESPDPVIVGHMRVGAEITAEPGQWQVDGITFHFKWMVGSTVISTGDSSHLYILPQYKGKKITAILTASKIGYLEQTKRSATSTPVDAGVLDAGAPSFTGKTQVGSRLNATAGNWSPVDTSLSYRWMANGKVIPKATTRQLRIGPALEAKRISLRVTGIRRGYRTVHVDSPTSDLVKSGTFVTTRPSIKGKAVVGRTLKLKLTLWKPSGGKFQFQWLANGRPIRHATSRSLKISSRMVGKRLSVKVSAELIGYARTSETSPRSTPVKR